MSATDPIHQEILYKGGDYSRSSYESMGAEAIEKAFGSVTWLQRENQDADEIAFVTPIGKEKDFQKN